MSEIAKTLDERGNRYGDYRKQAMAVEQMVDDCLARLSGWVKAQPIQHSAARYIVDKLCRAFNGDPYYSDNWHDIQGYAKLVEQWIAEENANECDKTDDCIADICAEENVRDLGCITCEYLETRVEDNHKIPTAFFCRWRDGAHCTCIIPNNDGVACCKFQVDKKKLDDEDYSFLYDGDPECGMCLHQWQTGQRGVRCHLTPYDEVSVKLGCEGCKGFAQSTENDATKCMYRRGECCHKGYAVDMMHTCEKFKAKETNKPCDKYCKYCEHCNIVCGRCMCYE